MDKTETNISLETEEKIACAILQGAKTADVAAVNRIKYATCREILHKYCRRVNPEAFDRINIDAANKDCHSPYLEQLRAQKHLFIPQAEPRDPEQLRREIEQQNARLTSAQIALRSERTILSQLEAEFAAAIKKHQ
ncbi:TPA: hypothetical protein ACMDRZ_002989 [Vibrio cholerae]|uniref:Uncharacterized protein n=1 Tax=Vibrio vulnificus TaxID=672 RepID=A0AAI8ZLJ9_VIBVL|nr:MULTISPECIES: hypothetical protein [Vibrio]EHU8077631.1 hypothetical protein [Vibrio cholerae]EHV9953687.1 hypothetical protein [Vibrio cholerae]EKF9218912.1 hypothetical protein [Vibrio cholerae]MEA5377276.1 hypothetical protein [Vibrio parahaemolyticus]MEB5557027.1 hypothetical protein [Vibrio cholerae]